MATPTHPRMGLRVEHLTGVEHSLGGVEHVGCELATVLPMEVSSQVQFSTSVCRIVPQVQTADHVADCSNPDRVAVIRWKRVSQADVDFISSLDKSTRISVIYRKIFPATPLRVGHIQTRRVHSTRRIPDRARATKDEVCRAKSVVSD